jgi:hypothetical protein
MVPYGRTSDMVTNVITYHLQLNSASVIAVMINFLNHQLNLLLPSETEHSSSLSTTPFCWGVLGAMYSTVILILLDNPILTCIVTSKVPSIIL